MSSVAGGDGTTTTAGNPPTTTLTVPEATAPPATATTVPVGPATPPATAAPQPVEPATPGRYEYATAGELVTPLGSSPLPESSSLVVEPATGTRQRTTRVVGEGGGATFTTETVFDYRAGGIHLVTLTQTVSALVFTETETLVPPAPVLLVPTGAVAGYRNELDVPVLSGGTARLSVEVLRREPVNVGNRAVDAVVVRVATTLPDATADLTVWLAPEHGIYVRDQSVLTAGVARITTESTLRSLTPT